jgi:hypothetical protein
MRPGELVEVKPTLETVTRMVIDTPPAQPLSLQDLTTNARASQA